MSRSPDYLLKVIKTTTDERSGRIGAGWLNEDGSISITLDPCIHLSATDPYIIRLFPVTKNRGRE